jgi:outer membrane lipoprotein LolB
MRRKIMSGQKILLLLFIPLFLSSCAIQKPAAHFTPPAAAEFMRSAWQAQGMLSYHAAQKGFSAGYLWQNQSNQYVVQVFAPLGSWHAKLMVRANHRASLRTSDGKFFQANNPMLLMEENLAWSLPVEDLRYWLCGIPAPSQAFTLRQTAAHDTAHIAQADWSIDYFGYENFATWRLPKKIILTQGDKTITVLIQRFKMLPQ